MIYFLKLEQFVKIGFTNNPHNRITTLQSGLPEKVELIYLMDGGRKEEKELHLKFSGNRREGEWFILVDEILDYIEENINKDVRFREGFGGFVERDITPIKSLRIKCGLTLENLGNRLGITKQSMSGLEQSAADGRASLNTMRRVAEATGHIFEFRFIKEL